MKKVLIVDDDDILRMLIADTLEDLDVEIEVAEDGRVALEKLSNTNYDLMLLDYMMPELTGLEVLQRLSEEQKAHMPIVMLTAKAQESDRKGAMEAGAHSFIPKPFSPMQLLQIVEELLENEAV
ncbi:response regulator transcription factor [Paenibacillus sp. L3-i20]|uniref:response regulator transcription factor n=1 Tax=Paenibacillus sp. L3-i20 TaxID=2905833 RepID=UPI001EE0B993|nr:response regulator [Paenibacillus sp. L3-i20]GKU77852.1 response regulator [Paenibacillus sp. L3-i20]